LGSGVSSAGFSCLEEIEEVEEAGLEEAVELLVLEEEEEDGVSIVTSFWICARSKAGDMGDEKRIVTNRSKVKAR
jgi:hypothetical protein